MQGDVRVLRLAGAEKKSKNIPFKAVALRFCSRNRDVLWVVAKV